MINEKYPESELTGKIIGCCMEVHRILGNARLNERAGFSGSDLPKGFGN